jgi:hypothetical protein
MTCQGSIAAMFSKAVASVGAAIDTFDIQHSRSSNPIGLFVFPHTYQQSLWHGSCLCEGRELQAGTTPD